MRKTYKSGGNHLLTQKPRYAIRSTLDYNEKDFNPVQDLLIVGREGLAAGRLFVNGDLVIGGSSQWPFESSGLCFESRFFITTKHWYFKDSRSQAYTQIPGQGSAYVVNTMIANQHKGIVLYNLALIYYTLTFTAYGARKVHLLLYSEELDLAIFRLDPGEKDWDHYIKSSQFEPTRTFQNRQVWSVGYATKCDKRYDVFVKMYPLLLNREQRLKWEQDLSKKV